MKSKIWNRLKLYFKKDYVGCFDDYDNLRQLSELTQSMASSLSAGALEFVYFIKSTSMTISYCRNFCFNLQFIYSGINAG